MKKLTTQMLKDLALKIGGGGGGVQILGVGNIERFDEAPQRMHPRNIFPDCKSVITIVQPIPRGSYRGITEGTHFSNYTFYSYSRLNGFFRPQITYDIARFIEDCGYEAVPVFPGVPEHWKPEPFGSASAWMEAGQKCGPFCGPHPNFGLRNSKNFYTFSIAISNAISYNRRDNR